MHGLLGPWYSLLPHPATALCLPDRDHETAPSGPPCREEIVHVLQSSTPEDMEQNVEQLTQWARSWRPSS